MTGVQTCALPISCCDRFGDGVDDAGYLRGLIEEIGSTLAIDRKRIYVLGRSNGVFMSYRMACEYADVIAGIASLAARQFSHSAAAFLNKSNNISVSATSKFHFDICFSFSRKTSP